MLPSAFALSVSLASLCTRICKCPVLQITGYFRVAASVRLKEKDWHELDSPVVWAFSWDVGNGGVNSSCSKYFCTSSSVVVAPKYSGAGDYNLSFGRRTIKWISTANPGEVPDVQPVFCVVFYTSLREGSCLSVPGGQRLAVFIFWSRLILPRCCREHLSAQRWAWLGAGVPKPPSRTSLFSLLGCVK